MKQLTKAEEQIMQVLWRSGKAFLREVVEEMPEPRPHQNTVATLLKILVEKEFVGTETIGRNHRYFPLVTKEQYSKRTMKQFVKGYFEGSFSNVVSFLVKENNITVEELELLLKQIKKRKKSPEMMNMLYFLAQVILVSGILYGYYHFFLRNKKFHRYNRYYLVASFLLSVIIPMLNIPVYFKVDGANTPTILQTLNIVSDQAGFEQAVPAIISEKQAQAFPWQTITIIFYLTIALLALGKIIFILLKIRRIIRKNTIEKLERVNFINTDEPGTPFSFFHWLFWNRKIELNSEKGEQIFRHELFHIRQRHSVDLLGSELLTVIFWINPFFHLLKKELKAVHEFLADRFAFNENNKWEYAELLLMQALQTKNRLVHPFFHNQIKRRIAMITHSSKPRHQYLRKLMVLPIAVIVILLFAFSYKFTKSKPATNQMVTVFIDAGHGGTDAGAMTSAGTAEKEIVLAIAQKIKSLNTDKKIRIVLSRESDITSSVKDRTELAKAEKADLFLSLHVNTMQCENGASGIEVMIPAKNKNFYNENKMVSSILLHYFSQVYNTKLEIKKPEGNIWVLENTTCPTALMELGYMNNQTDLAFITNPNNQEKIARSILQSIDQFFIQKNSANVNLRLDALNDTIPHQQKFARSGTDMIFMKTEIEAQFPGEAQNWYEFLSRNINWNLPKQKGAPNGDYSVVVQFVVDTEGKISDLKALSKHGYGMEEQVLNMMRNSPDWLPAIQRGQRVKTYTKQIVTFNLSSSPKPYGMPLNTPLQMKKWTKPAPGEDGC